MDGQKNSTGTLSCHQSTVMYGIPQFRSPKSSQKIPPTSGCHCLHRPAAERRSSDCQSTGTPLTSAFHQLSHGNNWSGIQPPCCGSANDAPENAVMQTSNVKGASQFVRAIYLDSFGGKFRIKVGVITNEQHF